MKFDSDTIENVMARMDAVKAGSKFGFLTNYFRQEMVGNVILSAGTERSVVFVNDEHDFFRLFFFTTDLPDLSRVLAALEFPGPVVAGYLVKSGESPVSDVFHNSGFKNIAVYRRMTNLTLPRRPISSSIVYADQSDFEQIYQDLFEIFNKFTDHLPTRKRLLAYINNRQVILNRREGRILGAVIFQLLGRQVNYNYLYNRNNNSLALLMLQADFYAIMTEKGVRSGFLWVNATNSGVIRMQESLGWKFDGLQDHLYLKHFGG